MLVGMENLFQLKNGRGEKFVLVIDQFEFRKNLVLQELEENGIL